MEKLHFVQRETVEKGWSSDRKYRVTDSHGRCALLRICSAEQYEKKRQEFENMQKAAALGVPMCQPLGFGLCDEGCYSLQTWIDGIDAELIIPALPEDTQYSYGISAGQDLQKIHSIPAPASAPDWEEHFKQKIDRKIQMYRDCPLQYENDGGECLIAYLNSHGHLLKNRPQCWQHGDFHIGNMIIDTKGQLQIIDFNRSDYGDPWEEFNRIVWSAQAAPHFASGIVDGYFNSSIPMEFWQLLALYIASNTLSSLPWALPFGQQEIDTMQNQAREVLLWYDKMKNPIPTWYHKERRCINGRRSQRATETSLS